MPLNFEETQFGYTRKIPKISLFMTTQTSLIVQASFYQFLYRMHKSNNHYVRSDKQNNSNNLYHNFNTKIILNVRILYWKGYSSNRFTKDVYACFTV